METKVYNQAPDNDQDRLKTAELKKFSKEAPVGPSGSRDHAEAVMNRASAEIEMRTKKAMLYQNLSYFDAAKLVQQADPDLSELYARGYIRE